MRNYGTQARSLIGVGIASLIYLHTAQAEDGLNTTLADGLATKGILLDDHRPINIEIWPGDPKMGTRSFDIFVPSAVVLKIVLSGHVEKYFEKYSVTRIILKIHGLGSADELLPLDVQHIKDNQGHVHEEREIFALTAGRYTIDLDTETNEWPRRDATNKLNVAFAIADYQPITEKQWVANFASWLADLGVGDKFTIVYAATANELAIAEQSRPLGYEADLLKTLRSSDYQYLGADASQLTTPHHRSLYIEMQTNYDRWTLRKFENRFYQVQNIDFWNRVLRKVSMITGFSERSIYIHLPVWCDATEIFESVAGEASRWGSECLSAGSGREVPLSIATRLAAPGIHKIAGLDSGFKDTVEGFLGKHVTDAGGKLEYTYRDASYVEGIVRDVRGWVISGGTDWEKVQVSFSLLGASGEARSVRVLVDGMLAPSIGSSAPPDSKFTYSMEPNFSKDLTTFANTMLDQYITGLEEDTTK